MTTATKPARPPDQLVRPATSEETAHIVGEGDTARSETQSPRLPCWTLLDASNVRDWVVEPLEWLVEPIIPKHTVGFMSGQPKLGKSLLALDLCLHLARAYLEETRWLGKFLCEPAKVLYVAREDPARRIQERALEIMNSYGWDPGEVLDGVLCFLVRERFNLMDPGHIEWLAEQVQKSKYDFLVLDVFNRMIPGLDENSAKDMAEAVDTIETLNRDLRLGMLILDHNRKPPADGKQAGPNPFDLKGSVAKYGCADFMICGTRTKQHGRLRIYAENRDTDKKLDFLVDVSPKGSNDPKHRWAGDVEQLTSDRRAEGEKNRSKVLDAIGSEWGSRQEICVKAGLSSSTVGAHLQALHKAGLIERDGSNKQTRYRRLTDRLYHSIPEHLRSPSSFK